MQITSLRLKKNYRCRKLAESDGIVKPSNNDKYLKQKQKEEKRVQESLRPKRWLDDE